MSTTLIKHPESIQLVALCLSMVEAEIKGGDTKSWVEQAGDFLIKIRDEDIVPLGEVLVDLAVLLQICCTSGIQRLIRSCY